MGSETGPGELVEAARERFCRDGETGKFVVDVVRQTHIHISEIVLLIHMRGNAYFGVLF